jgi:O-antigen/teichoic acid export membrane protein
MMRSAAIYFGARILAAICGLLAVAIYTRLATPEIFGVFTLVMGAAMTLYAALFFWIQSAILRFLPSEDGVRPPSIGAALAGFAFVVSLLSLAVVLLLGFEILPVRPEVLLFGTGIALAYAALEISLAVVQSRQCPGLYAGMLAARAAASVALGTLLLAAGFGTLGLLSGVLVGHLLPVLYLAWKLRKRLVLQRFDLTGVSRMASFGLPLAIVGLASAIIGITDRYILAALVGVDAAGAYAAPYEFAQRSLQMLMLSAFLAVSPAVFRCFELGEQGELREHCRQQARLLLITSLPVATIMAAAAPLLSRLVFGEAFRDTATLLIPWIIAATWIQGIGSYYLSYGFTLTKRTGSNALIVCGGTMVNVALNLLLIPQYGALGAAIATLVSVSAIVATAIVVTRRWLALPWPAADSLKVFAACAVAAPFVGWAARLDDIAWAVVGCGAAAFALVALLLVLDAAGSRAALLDGIGNFRRRSNAGLVTQS